MKISIKVSDVEVCGITEEDVVVYLYKVYQVEQTDVTKWEMVGKPNHGISAEIQWMFQHIVILSSFYSISIRRETTEWVAMFILQEMIVLTSGVWRLDPMGKSMISQREILPWSPDTGGSGGRGSRWPSPSSSSAFVPPDSSFCLAGSSTTNNQEGQRHWTTMRRWRIVHSGSMDKLSRVRTYLKAQQLYDMLVEEACHCANWIEVSG